MSRASLFERPIVENLNRANNVDRFTVHVVGVSADVQCKLGSNARRYARLDSLGVIQTLQITRNTHLHSDLEYVRRVGRRTTTDIVTNVHEHDGSQMRMIGRHVFSKCGSVVGKEVFYAFWLGTDVSFLGLLKRVFDAADWSVKFNAVFPCAGRQRLSRFFGELGVTIRNRDPRHTHLDYVCVRVALGDRGIKESRDFVCHFTLVDKPLHGLLTGELLDDVDEHRWHLDELDRVDFTFSCSVNQFSRFAGTLLAIEVRACAPHDAHVGVLDSFFRDVGVHVQRHANWHVGPDNFAHRSGELGVHVWKFFGNGSTVITDQYTVPRSLITQHAVHLG